jgi:hypothetical protein
MRIFTTLGQGQPSDLAEARNCMTDHAGEPTDRRDFLGKIAAASVVLTSAACASAPVAAVPAPAPAATPSQGTAAGSANPASGPAPIVPASWDNSWFNKLKARHKAVFEQPDLNYGSAVSFAQRWISGMRDAGTAKAGEFQAVLVLRHDAVPMLVNNTIWEKYGVGEALKFKTFGENIEKLNPIAEARPLPAGRTPPPDDPMRPQANIPWFTAHGHITLGCNVAFNGFVYQTAQRVKADRAALMEEFKANLLPGVILQPNGIYATMRAQEAGCTYIRAG